MNRRLLAALSLTAVLLGACSDPKPKPEPSSSPSPTVSLSPSPSPEQLELARLAGLAANARYDAIYNFISSATKASGSLRIVSATPFFRLDVATEGSTAIFIVSPDRTVSCSIKGSKKSCFLVARKGEQVPAAFDPGIQRLFSDAVRDLAANPLNYTVSTAEAIPLPRGLPASTCFQVERSATAPPTGTGEGTNPTGFESGRYCFAPNGVMTAVEVSTGKITLKRIQAVPTLAAFTPIATVITLPSLPPPSPSAKPPSPSPS